MSDAGVYATLTNAALFPDEQLERKIESDERKGGHERRPTLGVAEENQRCRP